MKKIKEFVDKMILRNVMDNIEFGESENICFDEEGIIFDETWPSNFRNKENICVRKDGICIGNLVKDIHWGWMWTPLNKKAKILNVDTKFDAKQMLLSEILAFSK